MRDPRDRYSIPEEMRYHAPREVEVVAEHHCAANCAHLREAKRKGFEAGARAERERIAGENALLPLLQWVAVGLTAALATGLLLDWVAGR